MNSMYSWKMNGKSESKPEVDRQGQADLCFQILRVHFYDVSLPLCNCDNS